MLRTPDLSDAAPWKRRFRAARFLTSVAPLRPERGLVSSNRSGVTQLYAWERPGDALRQLTFHPTGKPYGQIDPAGERVYYFEDQGGDELGQIVWVPFAGGPPAELTPSLPPYATLGFALSRDGRLAGLNHAGPDGFAITLVDLASGALRTIYRARGITFGPALSADAGLALVASSERAGGQLRMSLLALSAADGATVAELWDGPQASVELGMCSPLAGDGRVLALSNRSGVRRPLLWDPRSGERDDLRLPDDAGEVELWSWSPGGGSALLCSMRQAAQQLWAYDLAHHTARPLAAPPGTYWGAYYADDATIIAHRTSSATPPEAIELDAAGDLRRTIFASAEVPPGTPWRSVSFRSSDGQPIQAWLATPPGDGPFPTVIEAHGGPTAVETEGFEPGAQMWLDHGYAYMSVNYRGSTTFGRAFEEQIWGDLGHWELEDLVAARGYLVRERIADPQAILLTGWSYGGYLTLLALGRRPELWAGGMAGIAIADWAVQWEDTAATLRGYQEALLGGTPDQAPEQYRRSSPISYVEQVRAPLLVIQGRNDTRCPARPMEQYAARMRELGKPIEVEWFDAGHGSYDDELRVRHHELMLRFAYRALG